jgi:DNA gyrase/topoisomerase IV subunit A
VNTGKGGTDDSVAERPAEEETADYPIVEAEADGDDGDDGDDGGPSMARLEWEGDRVDASDALLERALAYGMYVNLGRALPDVRDGLKPVQRRIIHAMDELGARAGRPFQKSALTVGHVIGNYHPHGDSAVYDAMVRMAQDFVLNVPLIEGQGNWGSVGPKEYSDPPAAYRYTEARLSAGATAWLDDLRPEVIDDYRPNFTEKKQEPWVLPVTFPNLLVNGSRGIGWSMACDIPPHNLAEACAAAILLAENPDVSLKRLLAKLPGPDFPTGGIVVDPEGLTQAYERGQGTFRLQARFHIEQLAGGVQAVVVTELPYGVSPDQIVAEVVKAARAEKIRDVTEMPRNLTDRSGMRVQIRCKRGGSIDRLIADLMRTTSLRITVGINMTVLVDGAPRQIGLREALDRFVDFRFTVVTKRLEYERAELLRDLHRLVALLAALDAIDAVVKIVRSSEDDDDARAKLIAKLKVVPHGARKPVPIDDEQAQWILDMPIKRLARLNRLKVEEERKAKGRRVDEIGRLLDSHEALRDIVVGELRQAAKGSAPRRTVLGGEAAPVGEVDETASGSKRAAVSVVARPRSDLFLGATRNGLIAAQARASSPSTYPVDVQASDRPLALIRTDTEAELLFFTADGQVARLRLGELPVSSRAVRGTRAATGSRAGARRRGARRRGLPPPRHGERAGEALRAREPARAARHARRRDRPRRGRSAGRGRSPWCRRRGPARHSRGAGPAHRRGSDPPGQERKRGRRRRHEDRRRGSNRRRVRRRPGGRGRAARGRLRQARLTRRYPDQGSWRCRRRAGGARQAGARARRTGSGSRVPRRDRARGVDVRAGRPHRDRRGRGSIDRLASRRRGRRGRRGRRRLLTDYTGSQSASDPRATRRARPSATNSISASSAASRSGVSFRAQAMSATSWVVRPRGNAGSASPGPAGPRCGSVGSR